MAATTPSYPAPESLDLKAVANALEAGAGEWRRGDFREAVRWIHRAADAAESSGVHARAVVLTRIAADLMVQLEIPPESSPRDEASALASFDDFNDQTIVDSPAIVTARAMQQSGISLVDSSVAPSSPTPVAPPPKVVAPPRPARPPKPTPSSPAAKSSPLSASPKSSPAHPNPKSSPLHSSPRATAAPRARRALRVAVVNEEKSGRRLIAEVLDEGQALPAGASEALLVLVDPDSPIQP